MKTALIVAAIAVLAIGEYAFVELAPYPSHTRIQKLERLPVFGAAFKSNREARLRRAVERGIRTGDPFAYSQMASWAKEAGDHMTFREMLNLLRASDSATAEYFLYRLERGRLSRDEFMSAEFRILSCRMMRENYRPYGASEEMYRREKAAHARTLRALRQAAERGDEAALTILIGCDEDTTGILESRDPQAQAE